MKKSLSKSKMAELMQTSPLDRSSIAGDVARQTRLQPIRRLVALVVAVALALHK